MHISAFSFFEQWFAMPCVDEAEVGRGGGILEIANFAYG